MAFLNHLLLISTLLVTAYAQASAPIDRSSWTLTASDFQKGNEPQKAVDGDANTFWHSQYKPTLTPLPHWLLIDMNSTFNIHAVAFTPRQDRANGRIGNHRIEVSLDKTNWEVVAVGTWFNDNTVKKTTFVTRAARYVRLTGLSEAQGTGLQWSSCAEINVFHNVAYTHLPRAGWTVSADSAELKSENRPASAAIDGDSATYWHTKYSGTLAPFPHWFQIDAGAQVTVGGLSVLPRVDRANGRIGQYTVQTSNDGITWMQVASGTWPDGADEKVATFTATARYFKLNALSEAGNRGAWTTASEINLLRITSQPFVVPTSGKGLWANTVNFPIIPVAAAMLPNGKLLLWSAYARDAYGGANGYTMTSIYDPTTGESTQRTVTNTAHDMFCPGISLDFDGRVVVTGGSGAAKTSIYDPSSDSWIPGPDMKIPRGYQSTATTSDGRIFNIGGSWAGRVGNKNGEIFSPSSNSWSLIKNALVSPLLTADRRGAYRADNHAWLFAWKSQTVFQAGPSKAMNWYDTVGAGSVTGAGNRDDDSDAMNGNAVMYDAVAGKILTAGGAMNYENDNARTSAYVITLGAPKTNPQVKKVPDMAYARGFANAVVLPDGTVFVTGGQVYVVPFKDETSQFTPELFDPATNTWTQLNAMSIPRNYHSVAILLPDATVFQGGSGLCGAKCSTNHFDAEIFVPPYLLNADGSRKPRPVIETVASTVQLGATLTVATDTEVEKFSLVRFGTATHTVDTDQRRVPLSSLSLGKISTVTIPEDAGVALPGYWFLFAIDAAGTPSVAKIIKLTP